MDLSLFTLLQILALGVFFGIRRKPLKFGTAVGTIIFLIVMHLVLGIYVSVRGVDAPRTQFERGRAL